MILSLFQAATEPIMKAAQTEAEFYQGQPITWALLAIIFTLGTMMYKDLKNDNKKTMKRANTHGHEIRVECDNKSCKARVDIKGVLINPGEHE